MSAPAIISSGTAAGGPPVGGGGTSSPSTIPRWTGPSTLGDSGLIDNGTAIYTTARNVGIGTASPSERLHVVSANSLSTIIASTNATQAAVELRYNTSTTCGYFGTGAALVSGGTGPDFALRAQSGAMLFATGATERARIDSAGNFGIGTASPANLLTLSRGNGSGFNLQYDAAGNARTGLFLATRGSSSAIIGGGSEWADATTTARSTAATAILQNAGVIQFFTDTGLTSGNTFTPTERARIDSAGNFGIGTASPGAQLHVERAGGTAANAEYLRLRNTTNATNSNASISFFVSNNVVATGAISHTAASGPSYDTIFSNWNGSTLAEAMRIQQGGNVILNTANTGATIQAAGSQQGLKLPATPGNADTQTLDCYQEGTWTPTLTGFGVQTPTVSTARYVRIGAVVHCTVVLIVGSSNFTSTYGTTTITAPFTATYNAAVSVNVGQPSISAGQQNATTTTVFLPQFGTVTAATISWTFIV